MIEGLIFLVIVLPYMLIGMLLKQLEEDFENFKFIKYIIHIIRIPFSLFDDSLQ